MSSPDSPAVVLHLSDLHLGKNALDIGTSEKATAKSAWKTRRLVMQTHDPYILSTLETELKGAARIVEAPNDRFDFHCVTGDISTCATTTDRFTFARDFLTGTVPIDGAVSTGLRLEKGTVLCVPGNHDKLWEVTPDRYLSAFHDLPSHPPYVETRSARNCRPFTFFGIDSNLYEEGNLALGWISPATLRWLSEALMAWTGPADAVRILLLHHHPADLNRFRRRSSIDRLMDRFSVLTEGERLLGLCRGRVDVIMHGHEHFPVAFQDEHSGSIIVSAGTAMEWQHDKSTKNSFHVLVFDGTSLRVVQFNWCGALFQPDPENDRKFTLPCAQQKTADAKSDERQGSPG